MTKYLTPGVIAGLLTVGATVAGFLGKAELSAFLGSAEAANAFNAIVSGVGALIAGVLSGLKAPTA